MHFRVMGAIALQRYIGSLGGIGASGVGSSASYAPKDMNKEVTPEKVSDPVELQNFPDFLNFILHWNLYYTALRAGDIFCLLST